MNAVRRNVLVALAASLIAAEDWPARAQVDSPGMTQFTFGGDGREIVNAVTLDAQGNIYIAGNTSSSNLPGTERAFQRSLADRSDAFVAKFTASGQLQWATYLGGNDARVRSRFGIIGDEARAIAIDPQSNVWVAGLTGSTNFPVVNAYQANPQFATGTDGFLAKLDPAGGQLLFSTYLGGLNGSSSVEGLAVGPAGDAWVAVRTAARQFPTTRDISADGFVIVARFLATGSPVWQSRIGFGDDIVNGFAVDHVGQPHLGAYSPRQPCPRGTSPGLRCPGWYVTQLDTSGAQTNFTWALQPESSLSSMGDLAVGADGVIVLTGGGVGSIQTINAWQPRPSGGGDGFVAVLSPRGVPEGVSYLAGVGTWRPRVDINPGGSLHLAFDTTSSGLEVRRSLIEHHPDGPVYTSADRAESWSWASAGLPAGVNGFAFDVGRNLVYAAGRGGVFRTRDNGASWDRWSSFGGFLTKVAVDARSASTIYVGDSDLFRSDVDGRALTRIRQSTPGVGGFRVQSLAVSPHDGSVWVGSGNGLEASFDGGETWAHRDRGFPMTAVNTITTPDVITHDATTPGVVYAGLNSGLFRSADRGETWEDITQTLTSGGFPERPFVRAIAIDPGNRDRIYAGTFNRGVIITDDAGRSWRRALPFTAVEALAVDHVPPYQIYAALRDYVANFAGIMMSSDRGMTWQPMTKGMSLRSVNRIAVHPGDPARLYAASTTLSAAPFVMRREKASAVPGYSQAFASYLLNGSVRDLAATADGRTVLVLELSGRADDVVIVTLDP